MRALRRSAKQIGHVERLRHLKGHGSSIAQKPSQRWRHYPLVGAIGDLQEARCREPNSYTAFGVPQIGDIGAPQRIPDGLNEGVIVALYACRDIEARREGVLRLEVVGDTVDSSRAGNIVAAAGQLGVR